MSNPAVITLAESASSFGGNFRVEDNIGEAIHIHYNNIRVDLTTSEFIEIGEILECAIEDLVDVGGFNIKNFDPIFIAQIGEYLYDLKEVRFECLKLNNLQIQTKGLFGLPIISNLSNSRIVKAINGDNRENDAYKQNNYYGENNRDRVMNINKLIKEKGYPYNNEFIVLFNNQNIIRDGQHRAASLLKEGFDEVQIIRLIFNNNECNVSLYPWAVLLFYWPPKRILRVLRSIYVNMRKIRNRLLLKFS